MTLLIHPGFHKTGTSWLQARVFSDPRLFNAMFDHAEIDELIVRPHDFSFDADAVRATVDARRSPDGSPVIDVISSEILSGTMFSGSRESRLLADRLRAVTGDAKIMLTVRAQPQIMRSVYMQYVQRGGRLGIVDYLRYRPEPGFFWFEPEILAFDRLANHYAALYGADNVLVLPQELLARDRTAYFEAMVRFVTGAAPPEGITVSDSREVGASPPTSGLGMLRLGNLFRRSPVNPEALTRLHPVGKLLHAGAYRMTWGDKAARVKLQGEIDRVIKGRYAASNRRLQGYAPCDLAALGYEMED